MTRTITNFLLWVFVVWAAAQLVPGFSFVNWQALIIFALVLGVLNLLVKPIIKVLALPVTILTLGLFSLVINAAMVMLADYAVKGVQVQGFLTALLFGLVTAILSFFFNLKKDR